MADPTGRTLPTLLSAACGLLALAPLSAAPKALLLAAFLLTGPGLALRHWVSVPRAIAPIIIPTVGLATAIGATSILLWFHRWPSVGLELALVALVVYSGVHGSPHRTGFRIGRSILPGRGGPGAVALEPVQIREHIGVRKIQRHAGIREAVKAIPRNRPLSATIIALSVWAGGVALLRPSGVGEYGLLATPLGIVLALCCVAVVWAFLAALRQYRLRTALLAILAVIVIQRLTVTLITEAPIYEWTYKHIGVVDFIQRYETVPPASVDIYGLWPGFFGATAWFGDLTGLSPLTIAHLFAPFVHILLALGVLSIARIIGWGARIALAAAMIAELLNWVGQDYFSPQATGLVLALGVLAAVIAARHSRPMAYLSIPLFAALVVTHQLTPYWVFGVVVLLTLTRRTKPWWLPIPYFAILVGYLVPRLPVVAPYGLFSGFDPAKNATGNVTLIGTAAKQFTSTTCRSLTAAAVLLAIVCAIALWRAHKPTWIAMVLAFTSILLLGGQSYGGEAIFRVFLYAVPGISILTAPYLVKFVARSPRHGRNTRRARTVIATTGTFLAVLASLQSYFGLWSIVIEHRSQIAAANSMMSRIATPAAIVPIYGAGFPTRTTADYAQPATVTKDFDTPLIARPDLLTISDPAALAAAVSHLAATTPGDTYIIFTPQSATAIHYYGYLPPTTLPALESELRSSPTWTATSTSDYTLYHYTGPHTP
ncbi:hypothetical protein D5S18_19555 [Nocardia panacis]|uniref:Glycosyltransferase RgtA/B/C/D-like domain-containing protein n=1 Tax=Nocardia panacis TaxID=2340916 RepID=A0A3A4K7D6_9NOCA|nr:hypothetical protein [Nocardia panacis]RJO73422.1 hypothetical protein D5S18_19555 [Nocardia panacis]